MKVKFIILMACLITTRLTLYGQDYKELKGIEIESGKEFWDLLRVIAPLKKTDINAAIIKWEENFYKTKNSFTKSQIAEILSDLYITTKQPDKCIPLYNVLINSGISVFPDYAKILENNQKFIPLLNQNNQLIKDANAISTAEYSIQKPDNYNEGNRYPLIMILQGGYGCIQNMQNYWNSSKLHTGYLVAFVQGKEVICSFTRRFGSNDIKDVKNIYKKITEDYLIDTSKVILCGQSAGGKLSIDLAINKHINAQGLILAFPVKPGNFNADKILEAGLKGLRVSMVCGENDWAIKSQKEMSVIFDKLGVTNRLIILPAYGHEFPKDFSNQIDSSIDFIRTH